MAYNIIKYRLMGLTPEKEFSISIGEFLGAKKRLEPVTNEGQVVLTRLVFRQPPFLHEQALVSSWARMVEEEIIQAEIGQEPDRQLFQDISSLFFYIGSFLKDKEPMLFDDWQKRTINPPLFREEIKRSMLEQVNKIETLSFLAREDKTGMVVGMLEDYLSILRQAKLFSLSEEGMAQFKRNIKEELQRRNLISF